MMAVLRGGTPVLVDPSAVGQHLQKPVQVAPVSFQFPTIGVLLRKPCIIFNNGLISFPSKY